MSNSNGSTITYIAIDFDGTCVTHEFPAVGKDIGAVPVLRALVTSGCKLVLNTMRSSNRPDGTDPLADALAWFGKHAIPLHGINHNPDQVTWTGSPKVYAHLYIDDAALGCPLRDRPSVSFRPYVDWLKVAEALVTRRLITHMPQEDWDIIAAQSLGLTLPS